MVNLRPFQADLADRIVQAWQDGARDVLGVLACGGGKSVISAHLLLHEPSVSVFVAHRAELLSGESLALARNGVRHRVIGQPALRRECSRRHIAEGLYDHIDHRARVVIASVQTLVGLPDSDPLWAECRLLVLDEVHHQIKGGAHGKVREKMVNARVVGLSATPTRADGKGLGRHADGYMDVMVEGPIAREIELMGFLAPHVIYAPPSDIDLSQVPLSASGDYSPKPLAEATHRSHIVGDVVEHYHRLADGLLGMTFCVDVESCVEVAKAFRAAGVSAEGVTGKTPADARNAIFRKFRNREIMQLVSCEIAGEGFDLPDVEVISLARASESYALATQQIGRVKRILPGKTKGIVIDHVGNTTRHCQAKRCAQTGEYYIAVGEREWTLDRRERRSSSNKPTVAITTCPKCLRSYERVLGRVCPYCAHETQPAGRSAPEQVDGVLRELDAAVLMALQGEIAKVDGAPTIPWGATPAIHGAVVKRHRERQEAQAGLRAAIAQWAGARDSGTDAATVDRLQREFWLCYGIDVASAMALGRGEAELLMGRITGVKVETTRCRVDGCDRDAVTKGTCRAHYERAKAGVPLDIPISEYVSNANAKCSVAECGRDAFSKGFCRAHYKRAKAGVPLDGPIRDKAPQGANFGKKCSVTGCSRDSKSQGMCEMHRKRARKGTPLDAPHRDEINAGKCSADECERDAAWGGMCPMHYARQRKLVNQPK